ncbi:TonB-dependent receptor [Novosphingobium profundi]|uniref:TonB-dependent receptor n=1 Tax=Novosphingobium profundi TaxID=1774954 RepID=UPI001BD99755|nr:TonB-dependent receptor [Novosphingobium profundi]MBT0667553.1 TonB-dependent receptor [Novosphingobium profundi]
MTTFHSHSARGLLARLPLALSIALPVSAHAAEGDAALVAAAEPDAATASASPDIVVTARRREERSQDVPIAISAYSGAQLEASRTYNLRDMPQLTPSLVVTVTNPRNTSINIRGLGNNVSVYNDGLEPAVGVYQDGVYLARPGQAVFDMADLDHVEVLRGPQGTLFGKNTSAGAVVIQTRAPSFEASAGGDATLGNYGLRQVHAFLNGPLVADTLAARLFVSKTDRDGFTTNIHDGSHGQDYHDFNARGQLLFTPDDRFKLRVIADYGKQHSNTAASVLVGQVENYTNGTAFPLTFAQRAALAGYTPVSASWKDRVVDVDGRQNYRMNQHGGSITADYALDEAAITSVTAYRAWNWYPHNDADNTSLDAGRDSHQSNRQKQFSQELRIASSGTRALDYVAGVYYLYQKIDAEAVNLLGEDAGAWYAPTTSALVADTALDGYSVVSHSQPITNSYAAFAQTIWHVTPRLDLTTGLRYTYESKSGWFEQVVSGNDLSGLTTEQQAAAQTLRARFGTDNAYRAKTSAGRLSGQATLSWKVADDVLAYATYSRGHKFGGLNLSNIVTTGTYAADPVIRPETIDSYELGLKSTWFDGHLEANLDAFWTDDSGYQTTVVDTSRNNQSYFTNVGKVRTRGFEADLRGSLGDWLTLYASGTYDDAYYVSYANAPCPLEITGQATCDMSGRPLPGVSKWAASAGGEAHAGLGQAFGQAAEAYFGADYSYRSGFYTSANDSLYSRIPGYALVNLRFGVRAENGRYDIQLWARNLGDTTYFLTRSADSYGAIRGTLGDPRTYGLTVRTTF